MGDEIRARRFSAEDFSRFRARLADELALFEKMAQARAFDDSSFVAGLELEAWLIDRNTFPLPENERFLERLSNPLVVPELSRFNVELNAAPQGLGGRALRRLEEELGATWKRCVEIAHGLEGTLIAIGILPTVRERDLTLATISPLNRYYALNEQVLAARRGRPLRLDIQGADRLDLTHADVMLEAAATSFQVHLQVPASRFARHFNASVLLSAPMVAVAANSPYLFKADLWDETRIPLFEQAVDTGDDKHPERSRVTFGFGYLERGATECLRENVERFPVLLPTALDADPRELRHLRLHNGTIWRWNRPLIGFDARARAHLRIEHRVMPAGPTMIDMIANMALYIGAACSLAGDMYAPEDDLPFDAARENFYRAATEGLRSRIRWTDGAEHDVTQLLLDEIVPRARAGLQRLAIDPDDIDRYLDVIVGRLRSGQNGAAWQRENIRVHGRDFCRLVAEYLERQRSGAPVHEWNH